MDFKDLYATLQVGQTELDLSVETAGSGQGWVQGVGSIGSHEHLDIASGIETIKLVDDFKHGSLDFTVTVAKSCTAHSVYLIEENDAGLLRASKLENLSDHTGTLSHIALHELRADNSDEGRICSICYSSCCEGLSSSWRSIEENTLGRVDTKLDEALGVKQGKLHDLSNLLDLIFATS